MSCKGEHVYMLSCTGSVITGVNPLTLLRVERLNLSYDGGNPRSLPLFRDQLERERNPSTVYTKT